MRAVALFCFMLLAGCTQTDTVKLSANQVVISTEAAPICGGAGAAKVAQKMAAIETLRAGYDRYVIVGADRENNTRVVQTPGSYQTTGSFSGYGRFSANTYYQPGMTFVAGNHSQQLAVMMLKPEDREWSSGIDARSVLGPKWESLVKTGVATCAQ